MARLTMPRPVPELAGELVTLRQIDPQRDAADYFEWNLEPEMHVWTGNCILDSVEDAQAELERFVQMDDVTMWAVVDNGSGRMIGRFFICLEQRDGKLIADDGNRIAKPYWRKGHNRQARELVFHHVFDDLRADCYETCCWSDNVNSRESIEAHGFALSEEIMEYNEKYKKQMKKAIFRITRDQWERRCHP